MNISVLGGGSAGWMTALLVQSYYPLASVSLIESDEIGILGAGEGTTTTFIDFLEKINVPVSALIKNCKATIKQGIRFTNWHGDGTTYFHSYIPDGDLDPFNNQVIVKQLAEGKSASDLNFTSKIAAAKKVTLTYKNNNNCLFDDPLQSFTSLSRWELHFDAKLLAQYLRQIAEERGITRIEGKFTSALQNHRGDITSLILENGKKIDTDFVFDCSGFARLLLGKLYQTKWVSYEKHLPMKMAVPFFIDHDDDVYPQSDAIAMKYGWMWRAPVQGRYGAGYVFDSDYITADQALLEAEEYFGFKLTSPKTFKFNPGCFEKTLTNNCMAVGLAQSFVEPIEATAIWISYYNLKHFLGQDGIINRTVAYQKRFNEQCYQRNHEVLEFVYLHYLTKRKDTPFWKEFRNKNQMVESLEETIDILSFNQYDPLIEKHLYANKSWVQILDGLQLINPEICVKLLQNSDIDRIDMFRESLLTNYNNLEKICLTHKDFINYIKGHHET